MQHELRDLLKRGVLTNYDHGLDHQLLNLHIFRQVPEDLSPLLGSLPPS
jgi:hypothetical protein